MPNTIPSFLNSIAGETTELAKPVIGTIVPAPQNFPSFSYKPKAVSTAEIPISVMETQSAASASEIPFFV